MTEVRADRGDPAGDRRRREPCGSHLGDPAFEVVDGRLCDASARERRQSPKVAPVRVDGSRRARGAEGEKEALELGVRGGHGARTDSPERHRLLSSRSLRPLRLRFVVPLASVLFACAASLAADADASALIARNTSTERLAVSSAGRALVTYHAAGKLRRVLAWGAVDARHPNQSRAQVAFRVDYSGGWKSLGPGAWRRHRDVCGRYRGPALPWVVAACTAPDGSHWVLQRWRRSQANYALAPWKPGHAVWELRLSHFTGEVARIEAWADWYHSGRWHHLFGRLTYRGHPVYGYATTSNGEPLDSYGKVLYLDTLDSAYGPGWRRENAFVARKPTGAFCYGFVPHRAHTGELRPAAHGRRYRLSVTGPGVTPDVAWEGPGVPSFDPASLHHRAHEAQMTDLQRRLFAGGRACRP